MQRTIAAVRLAYPALAAEFARLNPRADTDRALFDLDEEGI